MDQDEPMDDEEEFSNSVIDEDGDNNDVEDEDASEDRSRGHSKYGARAK